MGDAGVVDEHVDATESLFDHRQRAPTLTRVRHVAGRGYGIDPRLGELPRQRLEARGIPVEGRDPGAGLPEAQAQRAPDPGSRPGDDYDLAVEGALSGTRVHQAAYMASISAAYFSAIGLRLSFMVGVSSSPPGGQSDGMSVNFLICSTRESRPFAASTPSWIAAISCSSPTSSERDRPSSPFCFAHTTAKSGSGTINAVL